MDISYEKIRNIFPHFNEIALTENDFWREAQRNKIVVREEYLLIDGYYQKKKNKHFILLNKELRGVKWLHTALHELMHFYLDVPVEVENIKLLRSKIQIRTRQEKIADALALMGILPFPELLKLMEEDLTEHPYLRDIVRDRIVVFTDYKK